MIKKAGLSASYQEFHGRSERIRTSDPLLPKQVRYQAALRSDREGAGSPWGGGMQGGILRDSRRKQRQPRAQQARRSRLPVPGECRVSPVRVAGASARFPNAGSLPRQPRARSRRCNRLQRGAVTASAPRRARVAGRRREAPSRSRIRM